MTWSILTAGFCLAGNAAMFEPDLAAMQKSQWVSYPVGKLFSVKSAETVGGKKAVQLDLRKCAGHLGIPLPKRPGEMLKRFSFYAKAMPDNNPDSLEVMLRESDEELYFRTIKLTKEWKKYTFDVEKLPIYPYGGAKIVDGKLDRRNVALFRFNNFPGGRNFLIAGLAFEYEPAPDRDGIKKTVCDFSDPKTPGKWNSYPPGRQSVRLSGETMNGKKVLELDLRKQPGHVTWPLPRKNGEELTGFSFYAKASPDSRPESLEVMLLESDGEIHFRTIKLTPEWKKYTFEAARLEFYPYGGAKTVDRKLTPGNITALRFNNYPEGRHFQLAELAFESKLVPRKPEAEKTFRIHPVQMPEKVEKQHRHFPDSQDIAIRGNRFEKDGKPYFMLGIWQLDTEVAPWLMRLNSADVTVYNADEIYTLYTPKKNAAGEPVFEWSPNPWYEAVLARLISNGIRVWHEHKAGPEFSVMKRYQECADVHNAGHFVPYDPYHPRGEECYREMFKTWMRYTRKYPLFCYELFNEMGYFNFHKSSRDAFREAMRKKFGNDIVRANKAWNSEFKRFEDVDAPSYLQDHGKNNLPRETLFRREGARYPNLLTDWIKFSEQRCYDAIKNLMPVMRGYDPDRKVYSTVQAHLNLGLDYGDGGVPPEALVDFSDFYSHELGQAFAESGNYRDYAYILGMLKPAMFNDLVRDICPDKPVFNAESPITVLTRGATEQALRKTDLADMHNGWKFFDATKGEPEHWHAPDYSDRTWGTVKVPAMWAESGYRLCQVGLYRKNFRLTPEQRKGKIFFNGKGFADQSEIWINGKKAGTAHGYNASFTLDISKLVKERNTVGIRIENRYFSGGMYYGGIRGDVSINHDELAPSIRRSLEPRHVRSFLWSQAAHGLNGSMYSYDANHFTPPARYLAPVKAEINSVADLLFRKENRPSGEVALVYPQEDLRGVIHKDFLVKLTGPATTDIMPYYISFLTGHYNPSVIRQREILSGRLPYRILLMPNLKRLQPGTEAKLTEYVRNGGILITNYGSLSMNEETHLPLDTGRLTGIKVVSLESKEMSFAVPGLGNGRVSPRFSDGKSYAVLQTLGAKTRYRFPDGTPAVTVNELGKGKVYTIAGNFDPALLNRFLRKIAQETNLKQDLVLSPLKGHSMPEYTDAKLFGKKGGSHLLYLLNFDLSGAAVVRPAARLAGDWKLRLPRDNKTIFSPSGKPHWSASELARGIPVRLNQFDPVVILLEPANGPERKLTGIAPERLRMLNELWKETAPKPGQPNVALMPISTMTKVHGVIPTARKVLTDHGFNVREQTTFTGINRKNTDVLIIQELRSECKNPDEIAAFIRDGGSLLICGGAVLNYHMSNNCWRLLNRFGLKEGYLHSALYNPDPKFPADNLTVRCRDFEKHPIAENVGEFVSSGANVLLSWPKDAQIILRAPSGSNLQGKPIILAMRYGKGRIVYFGDRWSLRPLYFEKGDNARLFHNMVSWLAGKSGKKLTERELNESLFITADKLKKAEEQEKKGIYTFEQPSMTRSYLKSADDSDFSGLSGGDPVIDLLKSF